MNYPRQHRQADQNLAQLLEPRFFSPLPTVLTTPARDSPQESKPEPYQRMRKTYLPVTPWDSKCLNTGQLHLIGNRHFNRTLPGI